jgi:hypothetical protein
MTANSHFGQNGNKYKPVHLNILTLKWKQILVPCDFTLGIHAIENLIPILLKSDFYSCLELVTPTWKLILDNDGKLLHQFFFLE